MTSTGHRVYFVVAVDEAFGIGKQNDLAWRLKKEMAYFKQRTLEVSDSSKQNMVIMGRTTWESIPEEYRPLAGRMNVVLSHEGDYVAEGAHVATSVDEAFALADDTIEHIYIIGGGRVFSVSITDPRLDGMYITKIHHDFECDVFFPPIPPEFSHVETVGSDEEQGYAFDYLLYTR